jgi:hypothetical protein
MFKPRNTRNTRKNSEGLFTLHVFRVFRGSPSFCLRVSGFDRGILLQQVLVRARREPRPTSLPGGSVPMRLFATEQTKVLDRKQSQRCEASPR